MEEPVINKLYGDVDNIEKRLEISEEELKLLRNNLKVQEKKFKEAKSSVYQATKLRNQLKLDLKRAKNKASGYFSQKRSWAKKNLGKVIDMMEEDL